MGKGEVDKCGDLSGGKLGKVRRRVVGKCWVSREVGAGEVRGEGTMQKVKDKGVGEGKYERERFERIN